MSVAPTLPEVAEQLADGKPAVDEPYYIALWLDDEDTLMGVSVPDGDLYGDHRIEIHWDIVWDRVVVFKDGKIERMWVVGLHPAAQGDTVTVTITPAVWARRNA